MKKIEKLTFTHKSSENWIKKRFFTEKTFLSQNFKENKIKRVDSNSFDATH